MLSDVWGVGEFTTSSDEKTLIEHWDGTNWTRVPSPSPGRYPTRLYGVSTISPTDAWAVGTFADINGQRALILHWDGLSWTES